MNLLDNYESFILIVIFCTSLSGLIAYSIKSIHSRRKLNSFKETVYKLMLAAEKKDSFGDKKFICVVEKLYKLLPNRSKVKYSKDDVQKWVQQLYDEFANDYLDNNQSKSFKL